MSRRLGLHTITGCRRPPSPVPATISRASLQRRSRSASRVESGLPLRDRLWRAHALRRDPGHRTSATPSYTENRSHQRRVCARLFKSRHATGNEASWRTLRSSPWGGMLLNAEAEMTLRTRVEWAHDWISDPSLAALIPDASRRELRRNGAKPAPKNSAAPPPPAPTSPPTGVVLLAKFRRVRLPPSTKRHGRWIHVVTLRSCPGTTAQRGAKRNGCARRPRGPFQTPHARGPGSAVHRYAAQSTLCEDCKTYLRTRPAEPRIHDPQWWKGCEIVPRVARRPPAGDIVPRRRP